jgi:release factor glutamine methyltransferase
LGTGSGAIIITLAVELKKQTPELFKKTNFLAVDISRLAVKIAKQNAKIQQLDKKVEFFIGDLLKPLVKKIKNKNLIIAANLPYLTAKQIRQAPTIQKEPHQALNGGADGLKYYRELFKQLKTVKYRAIALFCEISPEQKIKIKILAKKYFPGQKIIILKDWRKKDRLLIIK